MRTQVFIAAALAFTNLAQAAPLSIETSQLAQLDANILELSDPRTELSPPAFKEAIQHKKDEARDSKEQEFNTFWTAIETEGAILDMLKTGGTGYPQTKEPNSSYLFKNTKTDDLVPADVLAGLVVDLRFIEPIENKAEVGNMNDGNNWAKEMMALKDPMHAEIMAYKEDEEGSAQYKVKWNVTRMIACLEGRGVHRSCQK